MRRSYPPFADRVSEERLDSFLELQAYRHRNTFHTIMEDFQIFGSSETDFLRAEQQNDISCFAESRGCDVGFPFHYSDHSYHRSGVNADAVSFIVEADVSSCNGRAESLAGLANAVHRL